MKKRELFHGLLVSLILSLTIASNAASDTLVSGIIASDSTWTLAGSPYIVVGDLVIMNGVTLTIEPRVEVKFDGPYYLYVDGTLMSQGTDTNYVIFTSNKPLPEAGDWEGIKFRVTSINNLINFSEIKYAQNGVFFDNASSVIMNSIISNNNYGVNCSWSNSVPMIDNNIIENNISSGIRLHCYGGGQVINNIIRNNGKGVESFEGEIMKNNVLIENDYGYYLDSGGGTFLPEITKNMFVNNTNTGIYIFGYPVYSSIPLSYNLIYNNVNGIYLKDFQGSISFNTISFNTIGIINDAGTYVPSLTVTDNNIYESSDFSLANFRNYPDAVDSTGNYWGTSNANAIADRIFDFYDDPNYGEVVYNPFLTSYEITAPIFPPISLTATNVGMDSITISWDANLESDLAGYNVYWDTDSSYPYLNVVDVGNVTSYTLTNLTSGTTYYIAVTAFDHDYNPANDNLNTIVNENQTNGNESWYSEEVNATPGATQGSVCPDCLIESGLVAGTAIGEGGDTISVPIDALNAPTETDSLGFEVHFDATKLAFTGCDFTGTFLENWTFKDCNSPQPGVAVVGGFTAAAGIPVGATGPVVHLNFDILDCEEGQQCPLDLMNFVDDIASWESCTGCFTCVICDGDVNIDGQGTPADAQIVFECFLGRRECTPTEVARGDINRDGRLTPEDAQCIFSKFLQRPPEEQCACFLP